MVKFGALAFAASVLGLSVLQSLAHADAVTDEAQVNRIIQLSNRSQQMDRFCIQYLKNIHDHTQDSERKEFFASQSSARWVLNRLGEYPGTPISTAEALEVLLTLPPDIKGGRSNGIKFAVARLSHCHSIEFLGVLTRMMDPRTLRALNGQELLSLRQVLSSYLKRESDEGPRFLFQVEALTQVLDAAVRQRILPSTVAIRSATADLKWAMGKLHREDGVRLQALESDRSSLDDSGRSLTDLMWVMEKSEDLRMTLADVVDDILDLEDDFDLPISRSLAQAIRPSMRP